MPAGGRTVDDTQQRPNREPTADFHPRPELGPRPPVHADLSATASFAAPNEHRTARAIGVRLGQLERLTNP
jgi:hypothetical protein